MKRVNPTNSRDRIQREILPIPDIPHVGLTTNDAKDPDTHYPSIEPLRPPKGAPNAPIILLDDFGFGAPSAGPCHTSIRPNTVAPLAEILNRKYA